MSESEQRWRVTVRPSGLSFPAAPQADLLSAAQHSGLAVPAACRNGVCEICQARLVSGSVRNTRTNQLVAEGSLLMLCRSQALSSLELEISSVMAAGEIVPARFQARVSEIRRLTHDVERVMLHLPKRRDLRFHAGQYLSLQLADGSSSYFSIASSPSAQELELHIQSAAGWESAERIMAALHSAGDSPITLEMPFGKACMAAAPDRPVVMVAAGTGFAQMKSMIEYLQETDFNHPLKLLWGVRRHEDMYLRSLAQQWHENWEPLSFIPMVGDNDDNDWDGHHAQLARAVIATQQDWTECDVMASGSPAMVYTLMDALLEAGMPESSFYSDVLEYAPRT